MTTRIRPELSKKNQYYIDRHRYYELKHLCLQYPEWKKKYDILDGYKSSSGPIKTSCDILSNSITENEAIQRAYFSDKMSMIRKAANDTDKVLGPFIFIGVTKELSYDSLRLLYNIPCSKDIYYQMYRKFFWILSQVRG